MVTGDLIDGIWYITSELEQVGHAEPSSRALVEQVIRWN
jgi:hypothetical protein